MYSTSPFVDGPSHSIDKSSPKNALCKFDYTLSNGSGKMIVIVSVFSRSSNYLPNLIYKHIKIPLTRMFIVPNLFEWSRRSWEQRDKTC